MSTLLKYFQTISKKFSIVGTQIDLEYFNHPESKNHPKIKTEI